MWKKMRRMEEQSRQIDQGNERPEESMFLCLLGTCHPKIQLLEMLDP